MPQHDFRSQRLYVDGRSAANVAGEGRSPRPPAQAMAANAGPMRLLACLFAAAVFVWQEQKEYSYPQVHLFALVLGVAVSSAVLCLFHRGLSRVQPPKAIAGALRFLGRYTLEIYAIQLAGFTLIVKLFPNLAP